MRCSPWKGWLLWCGLLSACTQVIDFNRSAIPSDSSQTDAGLSQTDASYVVEPDAGRDAAISAPESDASEDAAGPCDPVSHRGCGPDHLCCDGTCVATSANGGCEACGQPCGGEANLCEGRSCRCGDQAACGSRAPHCVGQPDGSSAQCQECRGATDCEGRADGWSQCVDGRCAQCDPETGNAGCSGATPICDAASYTCVGCDASHPCGAGLVCDGGRCIGCNGQTNAGCDPNGTTPICRSNGMGQMECTGCAADADCQGNPNGGQCVAGACRTCDPSQGAEHAGCGGNTPICDAGSATCRGCVIGAECPSGYCSGFFLVPGQCVACLQATHCERGLLCLNGSCQRCTAVPGNANQQCQAGYGDNLDICDAQSGRCVSCTSDADCAGANPICDAASHSCVPCGSDNECARRDPTAPGCQPDGSCRQCSASNASRCTGATPVCAVARGQCVQCVDDRSCSGARPLCQSQSNQCVACTGLGANADARCTAKGSAAMWCVEAGPHAGECGACDPGGQQGCAGGVCRAADLQCIACDPEDDHAGCTDDSPYCVNIAAQDADTPRYACRPCGPGYPCPDGLSICSDFRCVLPDAGAGGADAGGG